MYACAVVEGRGLVKNTGAEFFNATVSCDKMEKLK